MTQSFDRITLDPDLCNGRPTIRGKRITVQTILEFLSAGESREEILRQYPSLEAEDIDTCLASLDLSRGENRSSESNPWLHEV